MRGINHSRYTYLSRMKSEIENMKTGNYMRQKQVRESAKINLPLDTREGFRLQWALAHLLSLMDL